MKYDTSPLDRLGTDWLQAYLSDVLVGKNIPESYPINRLWCTGQSLTVTPHTVTVGYSDTLNETKTITNRFQAVRVTNMLIQ